jgi:antitoxin MazE
MKAKARVNKATTTVRKWGNGHGILLPKVFVEALALQGAEVTTSLRGSSIVLSKTKRKAPKKLTLKDMMRGMNSKDRHAIVDFGTPQGKEVW